MIKPVKLPEIRKEAFTKAREVLDLSAKDLSKRACLSERQIEQIENGDSSSFYSAQVKFTAAKKVADLLKLTPEEAFNFAGIVQPAKAVEVEEKLQEEEKTSAVDTKAMPVKENEVTATTKEKVDEPKSQTIIDYSSKSKASQDPKKKIFLLAALGATVIFSVVNLRPLFFPEPVKEEVVIIQEALPEPVPAAEPVADPKPAATPAPAPEPAPAAAIAASTECPPVDAAVLNYKPDAPIKAGDMVYLQSKTVQMVCVVDATGKTQNKILEPGIGVSVYGKPPLKVLTSGLNQVDLYYQGAKVRIGNTSNKTINLEPAEIMQPIAPSNSTDSQLR